MTCKRDKMKAPPSRLVSEPLVRNQTTSVSQAFHQYNLTSYRDHVELQYGGLKV
jgi:hypothetical protein